MRIRKATIKDAEQLFNLYETGFLKPDLILTDPDKSEHNIENEKEMIAEHSQGNNLYLVAEDGNQIIANLIFTGGKYRKDKHSGKFEIFIRNEFRGQGVGEKLVKKLLSWAKTAKIKRIELEVWSNNLPAITLYKKLGFKIEGKRKKQYKIRKKYVDGILMAKII